MAFQWKDYKDIFKGEGIYHLTFAVVGRRPLLGRLVGIAPQEGSEQPQEGSEQQGQGSQQHAGSGQKQAGTGQKQAGTGLKGQGGMHGSTEGGRAYSGNVERSPINKNGNAPDTTQLTAPSPSAQPALSHTTQPALSLSAQPAPSHTASPALSHTTLPLPLPRRAKVQQTAFGIAVSHEIQALTQRVEGLMICAKQVMPDHIHFVVWVRKDTGRSIRQIGNGFRIGIKRRAIELGIWEEQAGHVLDIPFIRTLARSGQLRTMIDYVHANPDNAWLRHLHPDLYVIRRRVEHGGLLFDTMGKARLLDWPDRQVIALSRSLTDEQISQEVSKALTRAEKGCVTLTAAINKGEKAVARAVREAGFPLVVMLLDGFPEEGSEAARYYHPSGVYHTACGAGLLYLMAPHPSNYDNPTLSALTDEELRRKAEAKHQTYAPIPHTSRRWRMIAGNVMLRTI